jgi:hypothetical protein
VNLTQWLVAELDDTTTRLRRQILDVVPAERQHERMPGGNSVVWTTYHLARHAALALDVVGFTPIGFDDRLEAFAPEAIRGGSGLSEVQQPWTDTLDPGLVDRYATSVLADVREFLGGLSGSALDEPVDAAEALRAAGIDESEFGWLYEMWDGSPLSFFVRWPLIGHVTHHVGELTGARNQLGLSPFR